MHPLVAAGGENTAGVFFLFGMALSAVIGYLIGARRGIGTAGALMSAFLGPIGWLLAALLTGNLRKCPFCAESVKPDAVVCRYCGRELPPPIPTQAHK